MHCYKIERFNEQFDRMHFQQRVPNIKYWCKIEALLTVWNFGSHVVSIECPNIFGQYNNIFQILLLLCIPLFWPCPLQKSSIYIESVHGRIWRVEMALNLGLAKRWHWNISGALTSSSKPNKKCSTIIHVKVICSFMIYLGRISSR